MSGVDGALVVGIFYSFDTLFLASFPLPSFIYLAMGKATRRIYLQPGIEEFTLHLK